MFTKTLSLAIVIFFLFTFAGFVTSSTARESVEAFSFRPITLKEGIEPEAYEKVIKEFPSVEGLIPGVKFLLMKGDRGINKGKYIGLWVYDSVNTRNFYFPEEGESLWEAWMGASGGLLQQMMDKMREYVQPTDPSTSGDVTGYVAIKSMTDTQQVVIAGQGSVGTAFSFRPLTLQEGIEPEAFEKFIKESPSFEGLIPGVKFLIMKGDRGINKGKYISLIVYDSVNTRNFYFPEEGESLWEAWLGASGGLLQQMMDKMREYVQPTDPSTRGDVTDYVAIKLMQKRKPICTMSIEENKAIVRRVFEEVWNQRKLDVVDDIFATDHIFHDPFAGNVKGIEGYKQIVSRNITAFPDGQFTIEEQVAEGDKVATRWTGTGTHKGELMGIPPTNVQVTITGIGISHIVGGKIVEGWTSWDVLGMLQQLGVVSPIGEAAKK